MKVVRAWKRNGDWDQDAEPKENLSWGECRDSLRFEAAYNASLLCKNPGRQLTSSRKNLERKESEGVKYFAASGDIGGICTELPEAQKTGLGCRPASGFVAWLLGDTDSEGGGVILTEPTPGTEPGRKQETVSVGGGTGPETVGYSRGTGSRAFEVR